MATLTGNPKTHKFCAFCKRWSGDANLTFVSKTVGFKFTRDVSAKCMATNNSKRADMNASSCKDYSPNALVDGLL